MIDISVINAVKAFVEGENVLDGVSFEINSGEHVALLGKNGAGKTTLFRAVTGELELDEGAIAIPEGKRVGLISQIPQYPFGCTTEDVLREAHSEQIRLQAKLRDITEALERVTNGTEAQRTLLTDYDRALADFERLGGWDMDFERDKVANGLMIPAEMREQEFETLSGGEKTRVNLARLILEDTDILLLDEPTNHLDMKAVEWLEGYLAKYKGTVLVISHDRYFLDRVVTRSIELNNGKADLYGGNYSFYLVEKQRRLDEQLTRYEREQKEIKRLEAARDRLYSWATEASIKKSQAMDTRIERMRQTDRPNSERQLKSKFGEREFRGDDALIMRDVSISFEDKKLFTVGDVHLRGGERIALVGSNGAGKTTLLRIITGELKPDSGFVRLGPSIKPAFLPQQVTFERPYATLVDTVMEETKCPVQIARNRLGAFNFPGTDVFKLVCDLSGGEKSRLRLCILMDEEMNFLMLDEPTNHLDISSREWIENAVEAYEGTLLFVSHDRYFCEKFATSVWELEDGVFTRYKCGFTEYKEAKAAGISSAAVNEKSDKKAGNVNAKQQPYKETDTKSRRKEAERLEREVTKCEAALQEISRLREEYATDYKKLLELNEEETVLNERLSSLYDEWESAATD